MVLIKWREEFCTGIAGIDYEHQLLIEQINSVFALVDDRAEKEDIVDCLGDIYCRISSHFALEEQIMEKHGYDQLEEHSADHERLLDDIQDITDEFEKTDTLDEQVFRQKLSHWFQLHFKTFDSRLHKLAGI